MAGQETLRAFFSYVRQVDDHDGGRLSRLRERLQGEIRVQTGLRIDIFQDIRALNWGDHWQERLLEAAAGSLFLIPVVTPGYFLSESCRKEYEAFRALENERGLRGVILPVYYVETDELSEPAWQEGNSWVAEIAKLQWVDWRTLRLEPWESPEPNRRVEQMAKGFKVRLKELGVLRSQPAKIAGPSLAAAPQQPAAGAAEKSAAVVETPKTQTPAARLPARREIVVDAGGAGQFRTISDAVKAANADDILLVRPGTYKEAVSIEKSLTVIGDGRREEIVVETEDGNAFRLKAPFGRLVNLTIRRHKGSGKHFAVWIHGGRFEVEGCDISSESLACIGISEDADPVIRRSRLHDSNDGGIRVYGKARGTIEDNDISQTALAGIEIKEEADPTLRRNQIRDGKSAGVFLHGKSRGTIEDNDIFRNALSGLEIKEDSDPIVRRNRIHHGQQSGVHVQQGGRGTIEDNDILANGLDGITVQKTGTPTVRSNRIHENKLWAVRVYLDGGGTFENNDVRNNARGPWEIAPESAPKVKRSGNTEK